MWQKSTNDYLKATPATKGTSSSEYFSLIPGVCAVCHGDRETNSFYYMVVIATVVSVVGTGVQEARPN